MVLPVIISSIQNPLHLLHVRYPVNLCVLHPLYHHLDIYFALCSFPQNNHRVEDKLCSKKDDSSQPAVARVAQQPLRI